ncbi:oligosaccharide flippase family protein [Mumia qirimensis]|uniref:oligosaccharide flippase family protein n=1 Tax=Mumia qirimensis TaxID=3234852 RepID=UPI00351CDC22
MTASNRRLRLPSGAGMIGASATIVAPTLVSVGLGALTAIVTARELGPEGRGEISLVLAVVSISSVLLTLGINTSARLALVRPEHGVRVSAYLGASILLVAGEVVLVVLVLMVTPLIASFQFAVGVLFLGALYAALYHCAVLARGLLVTFGALFATSLFTAVGLTVTFSICLVLATTTTSGVTAYLLAFAVGLSVEVTGLVSFARRRRLLTMPSVDLRQWHVLIGLGLPALGVSASRSFVFRFDRYLVAVFLGLGPAGIYSVASTLSEALRIVPRALSEVVLHRIASGRSDHGAVARARVVLFIVIAPMLLGLAVFAPEVITVLVGPEYLPGVTPLRILLIGEVAVASFSVDLHHLAGMGHLARAGTLGIMVAAAVVMLDLLLIPLLGLPGAALASVGGYFTFGVVARLATRRAVRRADVATAD